MEQATPPTGLVEAAASGDSTAALTALRDLLAHTIVNTESAREIASLSNRFVDVIGELEGRKPAAKEAPTGLDQLEARRKARGNASPRIKPRHVDDHNNTVIDRG